MSNKITYTIKTADGKEHQVSKENIDKYGIQSYASAYRGATIRMRDSQKGDYDIPLQHFDQARKQGLHAFSIEHLPPAPAKQQPRQAAPPKSYTTSVSQPTRPASKPTTGGKPMTAAEKAQAMNFAAGIQQGVQRSKQQFDTTMQRAKAQQKNPLNVQRVTLGVGGTKPTMTANKRVVQGDSKLNAQTGKLEPTYITEAGNVYQGDRTLADAEQNQIDDAKEAQLHPIDHELKEAYAERDRLTREMNRRGEELDKEALDFSWRDIPRGSGAAIHTFNSSTSNGRLADDEWKALSAAHNQNNQRIVALEAERDKAEAGFWRGVGDTLRNPSFWTFGYTDMLDTSAMLNYGGKKTQRQKDADQAMIENTYKNQVAQSKYGNNRGFMYRAGGITAQAIPFMIEFAATDGLSGLTQAGTKAGAKIAEKVATKALTKKLIKYTGTTLGDVAAGVVMANTTGAARTASDIGQRHLGHVEQDEQGNYHFVGGEDWGTAIRKGEIAQGLEYYTEKLGVHLEGLPIGKTIAKGLDKIGLSKVTAALNRAGTSQYAQLGTKVMNRAGVNGYLNEVAEEEANIVLNSMLVGDNKMSDLFDGHTQADIWGGMLFSVGAMEAAPKLAGAVDYYKTKKGVKDADTVAGYRMTQERWEPLRDQIDNATNEEMADVVDGIIQNPDLHEQEKKAALNYAGNLIKFRGFNTAQAAKAKEQEETGEKDDETIIHQSMDNAYVQGHEASDAQKNDIKTRYEYTQQQLGEALGTEDVSGYTVDDFLDNKDNLNDKQKQAAIDYLNAKSAYNGMISQVKDNIDDAIKASDVAIDNHTHEDGNIYPATMKVDNRKVYVVGGHAQMNDDGTGIDHAKSSESIMVRDAETGKIEMVAPSAILSVDEAINAEEEKANAAESIRQTYAQQEANKIDGTLEFNVGDTYSVIGEDNSQHTLQVIGDAVDEKTGQPIPDMVMVSVDGSQQPTMLPKAQVQEMSDSDNLLRLSQSLQQREEAKAAEQQSSNTYSLNDEVTLTNEEGTPIRGSITADQNEDGKFEVYTEEPINGKKVNLFSAEELDALNPDAQATEETPQVTNNDTEGAPVQSESEVNLPQNNVETPVSGTESVENSPQTENAPQPSTALERIPTDESGQPLYEQTDPETAWDAIVEQTGGDEAMAQTVADDMVADMEAAVKKAEKTKTKGGTTIAEKIAAEKERSAAIEQAKQTLAHWKKIASTNRMRQAAIHAEENRKAEEAARLRKEQEDKERAEREEAERQKREALNGVPDFVEDKASDARARGYRRVNGDKVDRQEPLAAVQGKDVQVKFDDKNIPSGHVALIDADELQPSHKNGQRNPLHFIDEAQPKERKDDASKEAARKIASNIRPEEITSSVTAYTGAPTVNSRGEVIQGNNRSAALKEMWAAHQDQGEKYKQYLIDHAAELGLNPDEVAAMEKPVLVNMLDVNDDDAISLGQFVASDTESGGTERIKPKNVVKKLGEKMKSFANLLLRTTDEDMSFSELIDRNGVDVLKWMNANGSITPTQYKSAFDSKGNLTAEAKNDLKGVMYQSIFEGGSTQLEEMFNALPAKAQKAILATAYRDYDNPKSERMVEEIQNSIMAYYALSHDAQFMAATNHKDARMAVEAWKRQYAIDDNTGESYLPAEKYSNFALLLATMYKGDTQSFIQGTFNKMYDLIQGTQEETLFEQPDNTPRSLVQAIKETLNIEYNGQQRSNVLAGDSSASQEGRTGSNGDATPGGRSENIDGAEANQGGTERESTAEPQPIGQGEFGPIYDQFKGKANEAVEFLLRKKNGEAVAALHHKDIGDIDLVWGKAGTAHSDGFGLAKLSMYHPEVISNLQEILDDMVVTSRTDNRVQLESEKYQATVRLTWDNKKKTWLLTMFEKKNSALSNTTDTDKTHKGNGNDTATPESTVISESKDKQSSDTKQENVDNYLEKPTKSEDLFAMAERVAAEDKAKRTRKKEEAKVDTNPTEAQKEAGNYRKGHIKVDGMDVTIEQPKGSVRRGKDVDGKEWESKMHNTYGYIRGTESVDGDHIDIFLSDTPETGNVFVIDQVNKDGSFDEHKVMYGFSDMESAKKAYLSNYEDGWQGLGNITEVSKEEFKKWIDSSKRKTKPFAEYSTVKTQGDVQTNKPTETEDFARQDLKELEDFQKNTDTTGRTTIDVDRYEAEDLFAPLLLDGKTSRLGVLTVVPDKITDPSGQIAVYDYSDEIDEKTNSGWQKWEDLTDEYNKTVDSSDKAQERGDTATLGFTSVDAALKFYDWLNTGGHVYQEDANSNLSNIEYEDGNFSELTAEEPLFNVSSSIRSFIEGNLFREVDFSDSPNKNVNQAISKLTDDELLKEIAKGDSKEWNFYMEEYDRRHNKEFQEAVERYMNSLEDEKTSLDTAYGSYINVAKNWSNGGYHTTERTLLRAQLDAIEDYVSRKESEQLSSVESEAYHQAKETVRKVGYDLTRLRLRPLEEGEACHVERRYTESNGFSFTGKEHVESIEDIAYIFKQLETSSVENSFLVLIKDGTPTVLHLSIGSYAATLAPIEQAIVAADAINPDKVLFVHNHPSGNISASKQDMEVQKKMKEIFGGKVMPAIIINTTSGKFGMFSEDGRLEDGNIPLPDEHNNIPINVYQFSQQVFAKDWNPEFAFKVVSSESIAEYVSSHRLGEHKKMSLIILDQAGHITGNVFLPWTKLTDVDSHKNIMQIISYVNQMGGRSAILYGNYELGEDTRDTNKSIFKIKTAFSNSGLHLMDVINIDDSAHDRGAMEEDVEYGKRNLDEEKLIVEKAKADGTYMKAPNGKPTKLNERQWIQVRTQTFKSWFGDWEKAARIEKPHNSKPIKNSSKVVDENGEPMVVYHGTLTNGLRKFSTDFIGSRYSYDEKGFFFISNRRIANDYSISEFNASRRGEVIDAYVSLKNPLVVNSEWCKKNGLGSNVFKDNDVIEFWDNYQSLMIEESERNDGVIITDGETSMVVAFDPNQIKSATENNGDFSTLDDDIRYRSVFGGNNADRFTDGLNAVNEQFNRELGELTEENADTKIFNLGSPSSILLSAGVEDKPMKLYGNKVIKKMKKHSFALEELQDLPKAVANPIAVFDNYQQEGNRTILTELRSQGKNIMVAITLGKNGVDVDFNIVSSVFGKGENNVIDWVNKGYLTYVDKEKALNYLHHSERSISEALSNSRLSSAAKIVKDFENPVMKGENLLRDGAGNLSDDELSLNHDPVAKMLGENKRTEADQKAFAERERQRMMSRVSELADRLHLDNVEVVTDSNGLQGKKAKAKGFYSKSSGKITIVIPNHASVEDVEKTLLHEAVAHYGLRKLFGEHFDTFLDNVYQNAEPEIRREIVKLATKNGWDFRTATEEYLASLAEQTDFERMPYSFWTKIKQLFMKLLHSIGFGNWQGGELSDNELRYILWRSYQNLKEPGRYRSILGQAEDVAMQSKLKVGNYEVKDNQSSKVAEQDVLYRDGEPVDKDRTNARGRYEQRVSRAMFQTQEAIQDSMLGLKEAMDAILKGEGKKMNVADIDGFENAYLGENRLSSVNKAEADAFAHLLFKPMLDEVAKLAKNDSQRTELVDYMMAKHGLERNQVMAERDATEAFKANEQAHPNSTKSFDDYLADARERDYAGLTALTGTDTVEEAEAEAGRMVADYEQNNDTTELWKKVNDVTNATLSKSYECGMMNKDTYDKIKSMYRFYIPLRGFDEKTSSEAYAYLTHSQSAFNAPIKVAKGRTSKADDPFANIQSMAESAITQGNRNKLVKQKFLNFALNHPSDLVSVSDLWLKHDDVTDEWKPVFPDNIEDTDSADDVEKKLQDFEARMEELAEQEPEKYKHGKDTINVPYRVVESRDLKQHQVLVKRGGRDYVLTINGNPRAAQALNGQTNPDNDNSGAIGAILKAGEMVNRQLSAFYTTRNPDFVVSNFIRDMLYANSMVWVKESPNYALRFHRNIGRCNPVQIKILLTKHRNGKLNMDNDLEHSFYQFMMNGGETGYANIRDIEQHKNDIRRELKRANGKLGITKAINLLAEKLDEYNRAVENSARFAAFLTSREMGRTIDRSIYDAKEISVNFNKKGSGAKFMGAVGQTKLGNTSAFVSGLGRSGFVFWNAAIQGTTNFGRQFKRHPAKAFTAAATMFILGALVAGMGMGDGDDDNKNSYWNLPEYVRRSNILFKAGDQWVSIPLPVEYRAIYGMGELMVSSMSGKEHFSNEELGKAIAGQVTQILPIDFLEGDGGVKAFIPSSIKPFAEVYTNKSWTGMPLYKDTPYNKDMPEWTKAYKSANKYLVGLAEVLNEKTGGDAYTKGAIDINPAKVEYILNGYFGGVSNTIDKLTKSAETIAGQREYDPRSFLLLNRVLKNGDERTESRAINNEYYRAKEEHDKLKARIKHYEKDTDNGVFDYAEKIDFLYNSPEYARYEIYEDYSKDIDGLYDEMKEATDDEERKVIENELTAIKKQMIEEMNATRK